MGIIAEINEFRIVVQISPENYICRSLKHPHRTLTLLWVCR